ncbi:MAG: hypothetical protein PVJ63_08435 [Thioalkalispiraceae bacterium]|jgi:hypothetical protein
MEKNPALAEDIQGINSPRATFRFKGHFQGRPVEWICTLSTLDHYYQSLLENGKVSNHETVMLKRFIHIHEQDSSTPRIDIALDVDTIDDPTIRKTIIMIHNYKKLHAGWHEYGTAYRYPRN